MKLNRTAPEAIEDFSTDEAYGQLSRYEIMTETAFEVLDAIPEFTTLTTNRKREIVKQLVAYADECYKGGFENALKELTD